MIRIRSVVSKTIYERRGFVVGWTLGLAFLSVLMVSFFPAMRPEGGIDELFKNVPPAFEGFIGSLDNLRNFDSYIASQLFDIRVPLIVGIMAIVLGLGLSTREEEDGELRAILALPVSRSKLLFQKWLAMVVIFGVVDLGLVAGIYLTMPFIDDANIAGGAMFELALMTWLVMAAFGTTTFAAGMASGKRGVASLVGVVVTLGSFLLSTFSQAVDWLQPYEKFSLLHYFPAVEIVKDGAKLEDVVVFGLVTAVSLGVAWAAFRRRDVA